jgi:hypothetical protein
LGKLVGWSDAYVLSAGISEGNGGGGKNWERKMREFRGRKLWNFWGRSSGDFRSRLEFEKGGEFWGTFGG